MTRATPDGTESAALKRSLSLGVISFYGLGTILGAGIYVMVGKVAGRAGLQAPLSFMGAALLAAFTALSYAELCSRLPRSAGEAVYVQEAFGRRALTAIVGWGVVLTGVVSAAAIANGFVGYLHLFVAMPAGLSIALLVLGLGALAAWGVEMSAAAAVLITCVELLGLLLVLLVSGPQLAALPSRLGELMGVSQATQWSGVAAGAFLAFYAFIGFEDMVNMAEEVREPARNMPRAIFWALGVATVLYLLVSAVAVLALTPQELQHSGAPLALVVERSGSMHPRWIGLISLFAVVNGALVQIVMASRVLYGMAGAGVAPASFGRVHPRRQTPLLATGLATGTVLVLALWLPIVPLAEATSLLILLIYGLINAACLKLKARGPAPSRYPWPFAALGLCGCLLAVVFRAASLL